MTVYTGKPRPGVVSLTVRAEGPGGLVGDLFGEVRPGESAFGKTYEEWAALAPGPVEVS